MSPKRPEPFHTALSLLRARLRAGGYAPGARLAASEIGADLGLSATPVREALARLAGEGLVEDRRGEGVFVRRLSAADVDSLYRVQFAVVRIALATPRRTPVDSAPQLEDPVDATEALFASWVGASASRALTHLNRKLQDQLGPVRRMEPELIGDLRDEAKALADGREPGLLMRRLQSFHQRRVRLAPALATLLESRAPL